jgi:hypothetical protein
VAPFVGWEARRRTELHDDVAALHDAYADGLEARGRTGRTIVAVSTGDPESLRATLMKKLTR